MNGATKNQDQKENNMKSRLLAEAAEEFKVTQSNLLADIKYLSLIWDEAVKQWTSAHTAMDILKAIVDSYIQGRDQDAKEDVHENQRACAMALLIQLVLDRVSLEQALYHNLARFKIKSSLEFLKSMSNYWDVSLDPKYDNHADDTSDPKLISEFKRCPMCGSDQSFAMAVATEQQCRGLIRNSLGYSLYQIGGLIIDREMVKPENAGTPVPYLRALIDVCLNCGNVYAVRLEREDSPLQSAAEPKAAKPEEIHDRG